MLNRLTKTTLHYSRSSGFHRVKPLRGVNRKIYNIVLTLASLRKPKNGERQLYLIHIVTQLKDFQLSICYSSISFRQTKSTIRMNMVYFRRNYFFEFPIKKILQDNRPNRKLNTAKPQSHNNT